MKVCKWEQFREWERWHPPPRSQTPQVSRVYSQGRSQCPSFICLCLLVPSHVSSPRGLFSNCGMKSWAPLERLKASRSSWAWTEGAPSCCPHHASKLCSFLSRFFLVDSPTEALSTIRDSDLDEKSQMIPWAGPLSPLLPLFSRESKNRCAWGGSSCPRKATSKSVRTAFTSSPGETLWVEIPPLIIDFCMEVGGGRTCLKGHLSPAVKQTGQPALRWWLGHLLNPAWRQHVGRSLCTQQVRGGKWVFGEDTRLFSGTGSCKACARKKR